MAKFYNYNGNVTRDMFTGVARTNVSTLSEKQFSRFNEWLDSFSNEIDFADVEEIMWFEFDKVLDIVGEDEEEEFSFMSDIIAEENEDTKAGIPVIYSLSDEDCRRIAEEEEMEEEWSEIYDTLA